MHFKKQQEKRHHQLKKQITFSTEENNNLLKINQNLQQKLDYQETKRIEFEKMIRSFRVDILKINQERLAKKDILESELFALDSIRIEKQSTVDELRELYC